MINKYKIQDWQTNKYKIQDMDEGIDDKIKMFL